MKKVNFRPSSLVSVLLFATAIISGLFDSSPDMPASKEDSVSRNGVGKYGELFESAASPSPSQQSPPLEESFQGAPDRTSSFQLDEGQQPFGRKLALSQNDKNQIAEDFFAQPYQQQVLECKGVLERIKARDDSPQVIIGEAEERDDFVAFLCKQKTAGFELEAGFFPCFVELHNFASEKEGSIYVQNGSEIAVRNAFLPQASFRFGFPKNNYYDLGYDSTSPYYGGQTSPLWEAMKNEMKSLKVIQKRRLFYSDAPHNNYEFRTIGGLHAGKFLEAETAFVDWYSGITGQFLAAKKAGNKVPYYFKIEDRFLCIPQKSANEENPTISIKAHITFRVHLSQAIPQILWLLKNKNFVEEKQSFKFEYLARFLSSESIDDMQGRKKEASLFQRYFISGIDYIAQYSAKMKDLFAKEAAKPFAHQKDLMVLIICLWFRTLEIDRDIFHKYPIWQANVLKGHSVFLLRNNERKSLGEEVINIFRFEFTPFYDIYLPFQTCFHDATSFASIGERLKFVDETLQHWEKKENLSDAEAMSIKRGLAYLNQVDKAAQCFHANPKNARCCFEYSFSMYLADLLLMPADEEQFVLNFYYRAKIVANDEASPSVIKKFIQSTIIDSGDPSGVIFEYRAISSMEDEYVPLLREFAENFFLVN